MPRSAPPAVLAALFALAQLPRAARAQDAPLPAGDAPDVLAADAPAVNIPAVPARPLVSARIEPALPGEDVWSRLGVRRGELVDDSRAREALRRALASSTFAEARVSVRDVPGGVELIVRGERRRLAREVAFVGPRERPLENARADFGVTDGTWLTEAERVRAAERLAAGYRAAGWADVVTEARWRDTDDPAVGVLIVTVREGAATRLRRVVLRGVPQELEERVREAAALAPGAAADPQATRRVFDAVSAELRRGMYLSAQTEQLQFVPAGPSRVDALITVRAGPHYRIEWAGAAWFATRELERALKLDEERTLETTTLAVLVGRVRDFYVQRGFLDARARASVRAEGATGAVLRIEVTPGAQVSVRTVEFPGAEHITPDTLRTMLAEVLLEQLPGGELVQAPDEAITGSFNGGASTVGSRPRPRVRLNPERTYVPESYAEAARRISVRYREVGFLDAAVSAPEVRRGRDPEGRPVLDVTFRVEEGPRTLFEELAFQGNASVPSRDLADAADVQLGVPLNYTALDTARASLIELYRERGYRYAAVDVAAERSPDRTRARVRFTVREGPRVRIGRVLVRGNESVARWMILERLALASDDWYSPARIRDSVRALGELGFFSSVTLTLADPESEAPIKDLVVQVTEVRPYVELRGGFSTGEGVRGALQYTDRNLLRAGLALNLSLQGGYLVPILLGDAIFQANLDKLSVLEHFRGRLAASLQAVALPGLGRFLRPSLDVSAGRIIERQFTINNVSAALLLPTRLLRGFTVTPAAEAQYNALDLLSADTIAQILATSGAFDLQRLQRLLLLPQGSTTLFAFRASVTLDLRDQVFNPQRGLFVSATAEYVNTTWVPFVPASLDPTRPISVPTPGNTVRGVAAVTYYVPVPLPFGKAVLVFNARAGANLTFDRCRFVTYTNRQFFLGGADSMRGWLQDAFIPQDVIDGQAGCGASGNTDTGSATTILAQRGGDVFVNGRGEARVPFGASGFAGVLFIDAGNLWKDPQYFNLLRLRYAAGFGLRYVSPIGPVGLDLGFNLDPLVNVLRERTPIPLAPDYVPVALSFSIGSL